MASAGSLRGEWPQSRGECNPSKRTLPSCCVKPQRGSKSAALLLFLNSLDRRKHPPLYLGSGLRSAYLITPSPYPAPACFKLRDFDRLISSCFPAPSKSRFRSIKTSPCMVRVTETAACCCLAGSQSSRVHVSLAGSVSGPRRRVVLPEQLAAFIMFARRSAAPRRCLGF